MEMHLVHKSEDGTLAVIGVLIESGALTRYLPFFGSICRLFRVNPNRTETTENS